MKTYSNKNKKDDQKELNFSKRKPYQVFASIVKQIKIKNSN